MGCAASTAGAEEGARGAKEESGSKVLGEESNKDKKSTFRERRLSMSQMAEQNQARRRLSVYGGTMDEGAIPSEVTSPMPTVGCKTMGGFEPVPGGSTAKINQDRGVAIWPFLDDESCGLFGVYDGHGRAGEKVSEFVLQNLPAELVQRKEQMIADPSTALTEAYVKVDEELAKAVDASVSGTTAVTCLIKEDHLWLANSGDSRAVLLRKFAGGLKAIDLTIDHKPDSPGEMQRILRMGGHVTPVPAPRLGLRARLGSCPACMLADATSSHCMLPKRALPPPSHVATLSA